MMASYKKLLSLLLLLLLSNLALYAQDCQDTPNVAIIDNSGGNFIKCSPVIGPFDFNLTVKNTSTTQETNQSYKFEWGDGTTDTYGHDFTTATHRYEKRGKYDIKLTVTSQGGCSATRTYTVYNGNNPGFGLQNGGNSSSCAPAVYKINITGVENNSPTTTYKIWFDDGTDTLYFDQSNIPASIDHVFKNSSASKANGFTMHGVALDCFNRKTPATISGYVVSGNPVAGFEVLSKSLCVNSVVQLKDKSKGGFDPYADTPASSGAYTRTWSISPATGWSFTEGTNEHSDIPKIIFHNSGTFVVSLNVVPNGNNPTCPGDDISKPIVIEDPAQAAFKLVTDNENNCAPSRISTQNLSTGTNVQYTWSIAPADGTTIERGATSESPVLLFTKAGTYKVTLTAQNSCGITTSSENITIRETPKVTLPANAQYCGPQTLVFGAANAAHVPTYNAQSGTISRYQWTIEGGSGAEFASAGMATSANPTINFTQAGVYHIRVQAWNECGASNEAVQTVTIFALPQQPVVNVSSVPVCKDSKAVLTASSEGAVSYKWYTVITGGTPITTGVTNNGANFTTPALSNTTTYYVEAISANNCISSSPRTQVVVTVQQPPVAPVIVNNSPICAGSEAVLQTSVANSKIEWYTTATGGTPFFVGDKLDTVLTATTVFYAGSITNESGCHSTTRTKVTVTVQPAITDNNILTQSRGICEGSATGLISASVPRGGSGDPAYQWQISLDGQNFENIEGQTVQNLSSRTVTATTWFRRVVKLGACSDISASVKFTTVPPITHNVISANPEAICAGTVPAPINADPIVGGDNSEPTYVWVSSLTQNGTYTAAQGNGTLTSFQPAALSNSMWFRRKVSFNGCEDISAAVEIKVNPLSVPPTVAGIRDTICSGGTAQLKAIAPGGPYAWFDAATEGTQLATGDTFTSPVLTNFTDSPVIITYYVQSEATGGCTVSRTAVQVVVEPEIKNNTITEVARVCAGGSSTITGNQPTGGSGNPVYVWYYSTDAGETKAFHLATGNTKNSISYTANNLTTPTWFKRKVILGACESYSNVVKVDVTPALANNRLPISAKFCEGTTPPVLQEVAGVSVTGGDLVEGIQYRWEIKTTATGNFETAPGVNNAPTYQPENITQAKTWFRRVAISGSCTLASEPIELQMSPRPALPVVVKTNLEVCVGGGVTLSATPVTGVTFQWYNQAGTFLKAANSLTVTAADLSETKTYTYYVESKSADACLSSERVAVRVTVLPLLGETIASGTQEVCKGSAPKTALSATNPTGGNGTYHYQWQSRTDENKPFVNTAAKDTLASYLPGAINQDTWFHRVVKSADCEAYSTIVKITVNTPVVNTLSFVKGNNQVCFGVQPAITLGGAVSGGDGKNYHYQWMYRTDITKDFVNTSEIDTLATFSPAALTETTQYRRVVTSGACDQVASNIITINVNPIPLAPVAKNDTICTGGKAHLTAKGEGSIQWLDATTGAVLSTGVTFEPTLTATTTYHVRVVSSAASCEGPVTSVTVVVEEKISNNTIQAPAAVCYATVPDLLVGSTPAGGNGEYQYQWYIKAKNKTTFQEIPGATAKDYQHEDVLLTDTKFKRKVIGGRCAENMSTEVEIKVSMPLAEGKNVVTPKEQYKAAGTKPSLLKGSTIPAEYEIHWWYKTADMPEFKEIAGVTTPSYQPGELQETTMYMRQIKLGGCFSFSDTVQVTIFKAFTDNAITGGGEACYNDPSNIVLKGNEPEGNLDEVQYQWEKKTLNTPYTTLTTGPNPHERDYQVPALDVPTWYRRKVTVNGTTTISNEVKVEVLARITANSISAPAEAICASSTPGKLLGSTPEGGKGDYKYIWEKSTTSATNEASFVAVTGASADLKDYTPSALDKTTWFRRRVISGNCVSEPSKAVQITVTPLPVAPTVRDVFSCAGEPATLVASTNGATVEWYDQAQGGKILKTGTSFTTPSLSRTTTYYVQSMSQTCTSERVAVKVNVPDPTADAGLDVTIEYGKYAQLVGMGGNSYQWSPATGLSDSKIANPVANPTETTTYTLTVTTPEGCTSTDQVTVNVLPSVEVPNGFTPNGDGFNDTWEVANLKNYPNCHVEIFNRWGNKVFDSKGYTKAWDGRKDGQPLPPATYYYLIRLNETENPLSGNVTIIK